MKKYFSILYCLAALAAGCDDNNKEALAFDLSTDEWSFAKEGGTQNLIVLAPECGRFPRNRIGAR